MAARSQRPRRRVQGGGDSGVNASRSRQERSEHTVGVESGAPAPPTHDFTIVVVTHNSAPDLKRLLASIANHLQPRPPVIVVDAASQDDSAAVASTYRCEVIELHRNVGFGAACNLGVERASTEATVLLNPDCELSDSSIVQLVAFAVRNQCIAAPRLLNSDGSVQDSAHCIPASLWSVIGAVAPRRLLPHPLRSRVEPHRSHAARPVGWVIAACVAAPTRVLRKLGPFEARDFLFYEDLDLCLRARKLGVETWLVPEVRITHAGGTSVKRAMGDRSAFLKAARRREVVRRRLGAHALVADDVCELATYSLRLIGRTVLRLPADRDRRNLLAHWAAIRAPRAAGRKTPLA